MINENLTQILGTKKKRKKGSLGGPSDKEPACQCRRVRDAGSILGSGRSPGGGHGNPPQYSCLKNPMDRGAWRATIHWVAKNWTRLKLLSMNAKN